MANEISIKVDFIKAKRQAEEFEKIADQLRAIANGEIDGAMSGVSSGWKGDSADLFLKKGNKLKEDVIKTANQLDAAARTLRQNAQSIYNAEMRALEIAKKREAKG